jgi:hypothetical protein
MTDIQSTLSIENYFLMNDVLDGLAELYKKNMRNFLSQEIEYITNYKKEKTE